MVHTLKCSSWVKQHTPMIHFQHDQEGATLRATELKPKLDRFIENKGIENINSLFSNKKSLPYKVKVSCNTSSKIAAIGIINPIKKDPRGKPQLDKNGKQKYESYPSFFANIGIEQERHKRFVIYSDIILEFYSFNTQIIEAIKNSINEFFFCNNFGTRQSKGFGSFYPDPADMLYKSPDSFGKYRFSHEDNERDISKKYFNLFSKIDLFYKTLRSGINLKNKSDTTLYFKSLLFLYAKSKGWTWDKRAFKEKFIEKNKLDSQKQQHRNSDILTLDTSKKYLVRDLLGVATDQAYMSEGFNIKYDDSNEIQRWKSPITFKPISTKDGFSIFVITNKINDQLFDNTFTVKKSKDNKGKSLEIKTPPLGSFDIEEFIQFALKVDIDSHVDSKYHNNQDFKNIRRIYTEIRNNLPKERTQ